MAEKKMYGKDDLDNFHKLKSYLIMRYEFNAAPDGSDASNDFMSVRFSYGETVDDLAAGKLKTLRLGMPKDVAVEFAGHILAMANSGWEDAKEPYKVSKAN